MTRDLPVMADEADGHTPVPYRRVLMSIIVAAVLLGLTERETQVLAAVAGHDMISDIAARLHLSPGTVRNHLSAAIQKLGARNRAEAVEFAQRKGWL